MASKVQEVVLENKLLVSSSPHIRSNESVQRIMLDVVIALTPAIIGSVYLFGLNALKLILISVASSVLFEALIQKLFKKPITITDFSAAITGILIAFNLPASAPWWLPVIGSAFAIIVVKQLFGGLGANFMNPALAARAMLMTSWPVHMTNYTGTRPDVVTSATPLSIMKYGTGAELPTLRDMFIGNIPGVIGETSALLLLIGAVYLIIRKVIDWKIPVFYIGTTFIMLLLLGVEPKLLPYHILGGGLILGAFYMATDYSSSPVTPLGRIIFAVGAGILTAIIRVKGAYPEGVSYSILLMNVATPLIEKFTKPNVFGKVK
ncbi:MULTISPECIES: RnfABCDGE type electron transport complex subunit D [Thermoanaerobacter]|jgi:electron transport complex protein RnfD|uniref:Ion-translocating oxidoreductase complex subunit D n=2 Tax=Thermoanaerobacter TaxID=1754 RepID=B0K7I0_THEP3|nr:MULTISPECIES: RnfABCDGE type electron transport complex subunit D [Thermoanaerobacter]ABY95746.1 electron transport complex, RnfABCDGE type, D subunit [Thermoanaerobacter pseudethanolicus ATCC 33223]ADV80675.1 electron transport complex, RnfABCDGE type, D subunit [Thermoanaerobacter brockii subsp. finnii Ako-1]HBW59921.1 RnfABCDGE type electron transport complex subunit D [Thermoanaerobacter sp.]HCD10337.1 RnfABCDGE type electron transport complex subunit D [Thermoanaerobacter sp.]